MTEAYIHGYSDWEQERLVAQARVLAPRVFGGIDLGDARSVLEIGCAVGAELKLMLERWPHLALTGVDRSRLQIAKANRLLKGEVEQGTVRLLAGDACDLPFPAASFDRVVTIWALEHIPDTQAVMREAFRVVNGNGKVILTEVDNDTFGFEPGCGAIAEWWRQFNRCQVDAGGKPFVGQALADIARGIGATELTEEVLQIIDSRKEPHRRIVLLDYLQDLLLSGATAMKAGGYVEAQLEADMKSDFARARSDPAVQFQYYAVRVTCRPPPDTPKEPASRA
jgi:ubiquinone/menaquinone biosynthesis C-methylase UbiE